ncbi:MAG TPA: protein kinase, partial [Legionellaceae bacterium]|nr:protein kinase [Legionellaceae bacterium]
LHGMQIIHRDLKSSNVILDDNGHAKWCDFGSAVFISHASSRSKTGHSLRWLAPELLELIPADTASDIWALAMVFFELAARKIPYHELDDQQAKNKIVQHQTETIPEECQRQAPGFAALIQRCWAERSLRPKASVVESEMKSLSTAI